MAVARALRRWAAAAPVPVHAVAGAHGLAAVEDQAADPAVRLCDSPRHANVLLIRGAVRDADREHLRRLHDQMPHPRATLWWGAAPAYEHAPGRDDLLRVGADDSPVPALVEAWGALMTGTRDSEPDLQPDRPPNEWRGKGDYGQGGEGMMGGVPYGRPMAMTDDDLRDGLALDAYTTEVGPFLPALPPGLLLSVTLQGDVLQSAEVVRPPYPQAGETPRHRLARLMRLLGLPALAGRFDEGRLRRAGVFLALPPDLRPAVRSLCRGQWPAPRDAMAALPGLEWHEAMLLLTVHPPAPEEAP